MHRQKLSTSLANFRSLIEMGSLKHRSFDRSEEIHALEKFSGFVSRSERCFDRNNFQGHVTGSALVTNVDFTKVLLTLHGKLNIWLQLGGHADGDSDVARVALREAWEESGVSGIRLLNLAAWAAGLVPIRGQVLNTEIATPFDLDVHPIPARKTDPNHDHYDARYLVVADDGMPLAITDESHDLRWVDLTEARRLTQERSMIRQFDKLELLAPFGRAAEIPEFPVEIFTP